MSSIPINWEDYQQLSNATRWTAYRRQLACIVELEGIVATLPKCWQLVDGKPVQDCVLYEGMTYYTFCANAREIIEETFSWDDYLCRAPDNWSDSREAAEAMAETRKEPT